MHLHTKHRAKVGLAAAAAGALALSACGGGDGSDGDGDGTNEDGQVELTLSVFGTMGYGPLVEEYNDMQDDVVVTMEGDGSEFNDDHLPMVDSAIEAGSGLGDVVGMDEQAITQMMNNNDAWADLAEYGFDERASDYPGWKWELGHTTDGKLAGFGTDVGGMGLCFRSDLFEEAGLTTDREELAELWSDWDGFKSVAQDFVDSGIDADFLDSPTQLQNMLLGQLAGTGDGDMYVDDEGNLTLDSAANTEAVETILELNDMGAIGEYVSWSDEWNTAIAEGGFAVMACPSWMTGVISGTAGEDNAGNWDMAAAPGVAGNWGGSWLLVPSQSQHPEEAAELASWLTEPEQQVKVFEDVGAFPSTLEGAEQVADSTNEYFNDAPVGQIIADSVAAMEPLVYSQYHHAVKGAVEDVLNGVVDGTYTSDEAWDVMQSEAENAIQLSGL
ncbi:extracellular solute-binding protein [Glycomyces xiaoerkulensis]|uniref:extracellular solute-binding protein n=1 Tax=Glycomyces xiaoerkulensis TaxID=2038139 RepID=UPI000C25F2E0|nr:extracellular solute-binding protein [Glycomyces xiaoerkulensis]